MDSLKKNTFLTTYLAVLGVGVVGLGYLLYSSSNANKAAATAYDDQQQALATLQERPLTPNEKNLTSRRAQVDAFAATVSNLQKSLMASQPALEVAAQGDAFQSKLTETLNAVKIQAELTKLNSRAGGGFDLGFGKYLDKLPSTKAVPDLLYQLGGINAMVGTLLTDRVATIDDITRTELDVESSKADDTAAKPAAGRAAAKKPSAALKALDEQLVLKRYPMEVRFSGSPRSVQDVLNHLAASKDYFFAIRSLRVENERKDGPPKGQAPAVDSSEKIKKDSDIVLGGEKIMVWIAVDLIRFLDPTVAAADTKAGSKTVN